MCAERWGLTEEGVYNTGGKVLFRSIDDSLGDVGGTGRSLSLIAIRKCSGKFAPRSLTGRLTGGLSRGSILRCSLGRWIERSGGLVGPLGGGRAEGRVENWGLNGGSHGKESSCKIGGTMA